MENLCLHVQNVYKINLCDEGGLCIYARMCWKRTYPLNFLTTPKPPTFLVDMALAKEYHGKKRAFLFHDTSL